MPPSPHATNESYEIKKIEVLAAACCSPFMHQLGGVNTPIVSGAWSPEHFDHFLHSDRWRKDDQVVDFHHDPHDHRKSENVSFNDPFYGPESDFVEGVPKILAPVELAVDGLTKIFDNSKGADPLHIAYTDSVALDNKVTVGVRQAFTFDTTVSSETTVSGSYAGAGLEEKLSLEVHSGFEKEQSRDEEEDKASSTGVAVEFDCPGGAIKQVVITKRHQRELIPVSGLFVVDFAMTLKLRHWWNHAASGLKYRRDGLDEYRVTSVQGLYELLKGVDTNHPELEGFWGNGNACWPQVRTAILHLLHPASRTYHLDADKERIIENNADYQVSDLETVKHGDGAVVDLSEQENREAYQKAA